MKFFNINAYAICLVVTIGMVLLRILDPFFIETARLKGIDYYQPYSGESKDIFNPFRKPSENELIHLQNMVDEIYNDFVQIVSKERKIEIESIINDIGALIYTSKKANELHLIDDELNLEDLIKKIIKDKKFINYKILKKYNKKNSLIKEILSSNYNKSNLDMNYDCLSLRSSISSVLNYESLGC